MEKESVISNKIDVDYQNLLKDILDNGVQKKDRTGTGTISLFGRQIRHRMSEGFPLITTKKMHWKSIVTELLWFLRGDTNIKYLVENGCHIWDGDAYKNYEKNSSGRKYVGSKCSLCNNISNHDTDYPSEHDINCIHCGKNDKWGHIYENTPSLSKEEFIERIKTDSEFANKWGNLGPIYGKQWRAWDRFIYDPYQRENNSTFRVEEVQTIDQIADTIHKLKTNPDDRGIIVSAWNVGELDQMVLRPCHNFFQLYTRELSLEERTKLCTSNITTSNILEVSQNCKSIGFDEDDFLHQQLDLFNVPRRAISLMWNQRSVDTPLGLPFNIASYALLLEIVGRMVNMVPDELIGNLGDTHIYLNQVEGINEQLTREPYELPSLRMGKTDDFFKSLSNDLSLITHLDVNDFVVENYKSHPAIKIPLSN
jgi:thymidylate synthase